MSDIARWLNLIELTGWTDIFGIVLNTIFIGMLVYCVVGCVVMAAYVVYPIAQGLLWCVGYELSIKEMKENGEYE